MRPAIDLSVYLVTNRPLCLGRELLDVVAEAVEGGASIVQLREKDADTGAFVELARKLKELLDARSIPLIINDRVDVALAVDAAGVHVGQHDMSVKDVRRLIGPDKILGLTIDTMDQLMAAETLDVDYLGVGPIYPTTTKDTNVPPWGEDGVSWARKASGHRIVAIGSVTTDNAASLMRAGADGVAVVSAICSASSPREASSLLLEACVLGRSER